MCIDVDVLRTGATGQVLGHRVAAPSTIGTWLRAFTFGHVRQLDRVTEQALTLAWRAGAAPAEREAARLAPDRARAPVTSTTGSRACVSPYVYGVTGIAYKR